ncbi:MAG: type II secretion system F family protein [Candidatus ainarchaeum sp.]|nr:type II secretion system F family protein [Candidatus ainarchaeum sp.]
MESLDRIKKKIAESSQQQSQDSAAAKEAGGEALESIDVDKVEKIVQKMRKKYQLEGIEFGAMEGSLGELRGIIAEGKTKEIEIQKVEELQEFNSGIVKGIGGLYLAMKSFLGPLSRVVVKMPQMETLSYYLFSANMRYSVKQYVAITVTVSAMAAVAAFLASAVVMGLTGFEIAWKVFVPIISGAWFFFLTVAIMFLVPKERAKARGDAISLELPFALRHMGTELRSGIGLYRTMQAVATSDYGVLSEEFAKTITEIEEGVETKEALSRLALRTQSKALRNALVHMVRALKTGGNISEIMNTIADDVGFEMRMKIRDFAQKMNFFGILFIFIAILVPVILTILGGIRNSTFSNSGIVPLQSLPLTPEVMAIFFFIILPFLLFSLIIYIRGTQPKV